MATISNLVVNMIARTANFEAGMKRSKKSFTDFQKTTSKSVESLSRIVSMGVIGQLTRGVVDGITEMHKAAKEGQSSLVAFAEALPILGQIEKSFANMYAEIAGVADVLRGAELAMKTLGERSTSLNSMHREYAILQAGDDANRLKALFKYQDAIEKIARQEKAMQEAKKLNPDIILPNFNADRLLALKIYRSEIEKIGEELNKISRQKMMAESEGIWNIRKGILDQIEDYKNRIAGMSEEMVNMISRMRDIGAPSEEIEKMIKDVRELEKVQEQYNKMKEAGQINPATDKDIRRRLSESNSFQELNPSLVNVAALNPGNDPMLDLARQQLQQGYQQISLLTRIANGGIS